MKNKGLHPSVIITIFIVISLALGFLLIWNNYRFVKATPNVNDFLFKWVVTRNLIFKGESPYHNVVSEDLQNLVRGYEHDEVAKVPQFYLPIFSTYLFVPFATIENYEIARGLFMTLLEICIITMAIYSIRLAGWNIKLWLIPIYLLFSLFWFFGLQGITNGNIAIIVALFLIFSLYAIKSKNDLAGGFFLAFATIRPTLTILFIICTLIWSATHQRWRLVRWFFVWLLILFVSGMILIPDWVLQNIQAVVVYNPTISLGTLGNILEAWLPGIGPQLNFGMTILLAIILVIEWWLVRGKEFHHLLWTAALTLTISQLVGFLTLPGDAILLFLPLVLIFSVINDRWGKLGNWLVVLVFIIILGGFWGFAIRLSNNPNLIIHPYLLNMPITLFIFVTLYWGRWWAIRSAKAFG